MTEKKLTRKEIIYELENLRDMAERTLREFDNKFNDIIGTISNLRHNQKFGE